MHSNSLGKKGQYARTNCIHFCSKTYENNLCSLVLQIGLFYLMNLNAYKLFESSSKCQIGPFCTTPSIWIVIDNFFYRYPLILLKLSIVSAIFWSNSSYFLLYNVILLGRHGVVKFREPTPICIPLKINQKEYSLRGEWALLAGGGYTQKLKQNNKISDSKFAKMDAVFPLLGLPKWEKVKEKFPKCQQRLNGNLIAIISVPISRS